MPEPRTPAEALRERGLRPRKRLGQNFLRDRRFLARILDAAEVGAGDRILEIGAGTGVLTRAVIGRVGPEGNVIAVELDDALAELLRDEFQDVPNLTVEHANALDIDPCAYFNGPYTLLGNIPYYITGPILRHYLESACPPSSLVLMVQREVAERIVARPGDLSLLGVSVQFYATPEIVTRVPRGAFFPPPKVESAIIRLTPRQPLVPRERRKRFFEVARAGFGTKRKTLLNALSIGLSVSRDEAHRLLELAGIDERRRAETLSLDEWARLAEVD